MARTRGACSHAPFAGVGRKSEEALVHDEQRAHLLAAASRGIDHAGVDEAPRRVVRIAEVRHVSRPLNRAGEGGGHVEVVRFGERELLHACAVVRCRLRIFRERRRAHDDAFRAHRRGEPPDDVGRARAADDSIFGYALGAREGANEGEGLGNQFLANIRETDAICEVVRYFKDPNVMREVGRTGEFVDPAGDADTIMTELILADMGTLEKQLPKLEKEAKRDKELMPKFEVAKRLLAWLNEGKRAASMEMTDEERAEWEAGKRRSELRKQRKAEQF